jgi:hypothetical protein
LRALRSGSRALLAGGFAASLEVGVPPGIAPTPLSENPLIAGADEHYGRREEGRIGAIASVVEIDRAIAGYRAAAENSESAQARWKLARALYFRGCYTALPAREQAAVFERARAVSEAGIAIFARRVRRTQNLRFEDLSPSRAAVALSGDPDASPTFFWAAVSWGEWALTRGKLAAVKAGAAARIRDYSRILIALDPGFEEGGGYRILGRLHDQAPRIPFLTGWISRAEALRSLREAVRIAPRNLVNRHFLAEALAKGTPADRQEAVRIERGVVADAPSPGHVVEELAIQERAKRNLEVWK